jgi:Ni/Co efflux regulator RcnB
MKLLYCVFATTMLVTLPAFAAPGDLSNIQLAQRNPEQEQGRERGGERGNQDRGQGENRGRAEEPRGGPRAGAPAVRQEAPNPRAQQNGRGENQTARGRQNVRGPIEHGPSQYEKRAFQRNVTAPRRFRIGAFRAPQGWQYRRWAFGQTLPRVYWAQPYWITNFWLYDLDRPPVGCEWVRSGPDALLIDTSTGEILEAEYNVFY